MAMLQFVAMDGESQQSLELRSGSEAETIMIGRVIGQRLEAGDLVLLHGQFGAGKTHLTKGLAAGLGADPDDVNSPSFVIINEYASDRAHGGMPIYHIDLYRTETSHDLSTIGIEACLQGDGICIIEWAERVSDWLPAGRLAIRIEVVGEDSRTLHITAYGGRYQQLVDDLRRQLVSTVAQHGEAERESQAGSSLPAQPPTLSA